MPCSITGKSAIKTLGGWEAIEVTLKDIGTPAGRLNKICKRLKVEGVMVTGEPRPIRPGSKDHGARIKGGDGCTIELPGRHTLSDPLLKK